MRRVKKLVGALGAGASIVLGLVRSVRGGRREAPAPGWPPRPEPSSAAPPPASAAPAPAASAPASPAPASPTPPAPAVGAEPLVVKGVVVDDPAGLLARANDASEDALRELGIKGKALVTLVENRPYASAEALGDTVGVGRRTIQSLCEGL